MSDTSHFFSFKHYFEIATFVLLMIQTTQNVGMHFLSVSNCFCCTCIIVYTKYVAGAFRDQSLGEGRGQNTKGPPLDAKCKCSVHGGNHEGSPLGCLIRKALKFDHFSRTPWGKTDNFSAFTRYAPPDAKIVTISTL